jgi:hypothetical protein
MKHLIFFLLTSGLIFSFNFKGQAQYSITTIAGNGIAGYAGDGGKADTAQLNMPSGVWRSSRTGNIYIADTRNNRIRKIDDENKINTCAGNGAIYTPPTYYTETIPDSMSLNSPLCVAVNDSEEIFISETPNNILWRLSPKYSPWVPIGRYMGDDTAGYMGDSLYFYTNKSRVNDPAGICFNNFWFSRSFVGSQVFLADKNNHVVRYRDRYSGIIYTIAGNGTAGYSGDGGPAPFAQLNAPFAIATDKIGNLYIADSGNHTVRKVDSFGIITTIAGTGIAGYSGDGDSAIHAQLNSPQGVGVDDSGNVYISDAANNRIRMIYYKTGIISTIAGTGIAGFNGDGRADTTELNYPRGIYIDVENSRLYFADAYNNRVRKMILPGPTDVPGIRQGSFNVDIYPNPSNGLFTIQTDQSDLTIEVYNLMGERVYHSGLDKKITAIDLTAQPAGVYFVHMLSGNGNIVKKVIINK